MSIINKMHQDFEKTQSSQPVLGTLPKKKNSQKIILICLSLLLVASSIGLSYVIFTQKNESPKSMVNNDAEIIKASEKIVLNQNEQTPSVAPIVVNVPAKKEIPIEPVKEIEVKQVEVITAITPKRTEKHKEPPAPKKAIIKKELTSQSPKTNKQVVRNTPVKTEIVSVTQDPIEESAYLEIKPAQISSSELAQIYLKDADKAEGKGDFKLAAQKREQALFIEPQLNEVRKSLALYYHSQGDINKAQNLLQKGALISPQYSDFHLMLARMALKAGNEKKAYRYLEQSPPEVKGNLDYYVSYAVLALKLKQYDQAENHYNKLLSQTPHNGRWRMSLAITQDKQQKTELAVENYKKALLTEDLSIKAKSYIDHRLLYIKQNRGMQ